MKDQMLNGILSKEAITRRKRGHNSSSNHSLVGNIKLVKPQKAALLENRIIQVSRQNLSF